MCIKVFSIFFWVSLLLSTLTSYGQSYSWENPPDVLENQDSIFIVQRSTGTLAFKIFVNPYISMYKMANFFEQDIEELYTINKTPKGTPLEDSTYIYIPFQKDQLITNYFGRKYFRKYHKVYYKVKPKETLYHLSKNIFDINPKVIKRRNKLTSDNLKVGQILFLGWIPHQGFYEPQVSEEMKNANIDWESLQESYDKASAEGTLGIDQGIAFWNQKSTTSGFFVLHRTAKVGSYVEITNPMFGRKVFAKVAGKIPANVYPQEVKIVLSKDVSKELGAKDPRFFVKIRYLHS